MPDPRITAFLTASGLVPDPAQTRLTPLTGGVSSDIWKVETERGCFVVKQALPQLRVAQEWKAPVSRNASEVDWLRAAGNIVPGAVPKILASDQAAGLFAMDWLDPASHPVWKAELHGARAVPAFAAAVGRTLAAIHAATAGDAAVAARFATTATFHAIRVEPYIEATARAHADLAGPLMELARSTLAARVALVHGDVSPKNILVGPHGPVFLDAECAWYGEPAFDLAFCLNHLLLKCLWTPAAAPHFLDCFDALAQAYLGGVTWEAPAAIEQRIARLLPALLLARVDGKSPVEYVTQGSERDRVRRVARPLIAAPPAQLAAIRAAWAQEVLP